MPSKSVSAPFLMGCMFFKSVISQTRPWFTSRWRLEVEIPVPYPHPPYRPRISQGVLEEVRSQFPVGAVGSPSLRENSRQKLWPTRGGWGQKKKKKETMAQLKLTDSIADVL